MRSLFLLVALFLILGCIYLDPVVGCWQQTETRSDSSVVHLGSQPSSGDEQIQFDADGGFSTSGFVATFEKAHFGKWKYISLDTIEIQYLDESALYIGGVITSTIQTVTIDKKKQLLYYNGLTFAKGCG